MEIKNAKFAPIILFVYNRLPHTKKTIEALQMNSLAKKSNLFIFSDAAKNDKEKKNVIEVREYIKKITGFKNIYIQTAPNNLGAGGSVISGITEIINLHGAAIVLEDDLLVSKHFLDYMNEGLEFYKNDKKLFSISGFNFKKFKKTKCKKTIWLLHGRASSWGWATWKDRWSDIDFEVLDYNIFKNNKNMQQDFNKFGKDLSEGLITEMEKGNNSWDLRVAYHCYKNKLCTIMPRLSLVQNIGFDGSGTHYIKLENKNNLSKINNNYKYKFESISSIDDGGIANKHYLDCHYPQKNIVSKIMKNIEKRVRFSKTRKAMKNIVRKIFMV